MDAVSSTFEVMDDSSDEEFFDKLVDEVDDDDNKEGALKDKDLDEAKSTSNVSKNGVRIAAATTTPQVIPLAKGSSVNSVGENVEENLDSGTKNSVIYDKKKVESESDCKTNEDKVRKGGGVKQVDWSAFTCNSGIRSGVGSGSCSEFFNELDDDFDSTFLGNVVDHSGVTSENVGGYSSTVDYVQYQEGQECLSAMDQATEKNIEYWESLYPGWKYDVNTGQWHRVECCNENATTLQNYDTNNAGFDCNAVGTTQQSNHSYFHHTGQSTLGTVGSAVDGYKSGSVYNYDQSSLGNVGYPSHMLFDPQYPGWYYDSIAQEWRSLESYNASLTSQKVATHEQYSQRGNSSYDNYQQTDQTSQVMGWSGTTVGDYTQQNFSMSRQGAVATCEANNYTENQMFSNYDGYRSPDHQNQQIWYNSSGTASSPEQTSPNYGSSNRVVGMQNFSLDWNFFQHHNQHKNEMSQQNHLSQSYGDSRNSLTYSQQPAEIGVQSFSASAEGRSSAGRPPHALVTFGFGGKLILMKDNSSLQTSSSNGNQDSSAGVITMINLIDIFLAKNKSSCIGFAARDYFHSLCQQSFSSPLVGVSVANKELCKWIDDKISKCGSQDMDYRKGELLRLLFSLLKIACHFKGKFRSPFGTERTLKESECPESAVADLFASAKKNVSKYGALGRCLQNFPSEGQIQATAVEVQKLLVSGRIKEALQLAQEGQLWGPALVLAAQLGDQFFGDTVKQMALCQLEEGSPLRTLCLLISGKPADVFCSSDNTSAKHVSQQSAQTGALAMLHDWEENLAIITANRTKDDELVIIHLGDCLWKEKAEVIGAHICYLVAEATFESYSDSARICLIGADHWRCPRTYASPEAIQRTELYEYSKVLGNPQFLLLPFQPYKLIYAFMLAEVGKLSESLRYCQAILKCLKIGRAPEVDTWKNLVTSLDERLRIHLQGGYSTTMAPSKLVGKLLNLFDSTAHRVVGGLPPPVPSTSHSSAQHKHERQKLVPHVSNSRSSVSKSSLAPSASMEPISEWTVNRTTPRHSRSISEPDIGKTPRKESSPDKHDKTSGLGGYSKFGHFGSQLFHKTVGRVLKARPERQAKLGDKNKFYYDENLKRWVEEGADVSSEETILQPPPTTAALLSKSFNENLRDKLQTEFSHANGGAESPSPTSSDSGSGIPPNPHHFSSRGRMCIRSRYVDTFNKGSGNPNIFQSPTISPRLGTGGPTKFFIPSPVSTTNGSPTSPCSNDSPTSFNERKIQRMPSMDNITYKRMGLIAKRNSPLAPHSRRTVSWSGSFSEVADPYNISGFQTLGDALSTPPPTFLPVDI